MHLSVIPSIVILQYDISERPTIPCTRRGIIWMICMAFKIKCWKLCKKYYVLSNCYKMLVGCSYGNFIIIENICIIWCTHYFVFLLSITSIKPFSSRMYPTPRMINVKQKPKDYVLELLNQWPLSIYSGVSPVILNSESLLNMKDIYHERTS